MVSPVDSSRLSQPHSLIYKPIVYKPRFALMAASWAVWLQIFWPCPSAPGLVSLDFGLTQNLENPVLEAGFLWNSLTQPNEALCLLVFKLIAKC